MNASTRKSILYVDDDRDDQMLFREAAKETHPEFLCVIASDGAEAIHYLATQVPVCIYMDINMPKMNGFELLAILKSDKRLAEVPVFMLSTSLSSENIALAKTLGAADYLTKPNSFEGLIEILHKCYQTHIAEARQKKTD